MQLRYDEELVEAAVFLCASGRRPGIPSLQIRRYHAEREKLYRILDPDARNAAFFKLHLEWFREWGLEQALLDVLNEFPLLRRNLTVLAFRKARSRAEEGAELFVSAETGHNAVVALLPERFAGESPFPSGRGRREGERGESRESEIASSHNPVAPAQRLPLASFLRHELLHLHDMLDPAFGYSPEVPLPSADRARERLIRERYRLLWNITVDGRLAQSGRAALLDEPSHRATFERAFDFWPESRRNEVFHQLWTGDRPRHADLIALASDPRQTRHARQTEPGAPCPLCGFPTFAWAAPDRLTEVVQTAIKREFPNWAAEQGACARCAEVYRLRAASAS